ncbi:MAG: YihY/virulence factor BrkB family protein, partial [Xanthobacteraceae bacterium]
FGTSRSSDEPTVVQRARAHEPGRGRHAQTPWQIPWKGWKDILWRTYQQTSEDRLLAVAAGVVFYGLLAVFPAVTALVSLYGLFASPAAIGEHLSLAAGILPQSSIDILRDHINQLMAGSGAKLGLGFVFGLAVALWSANAGVKAIIDALNVVYDEQEKRGFIKLTLVSLAFTLAAIGSALLALGAVVVFPVMLKYIGLPDAADLLMRIARWPLLLILILIGLAVLYRYAPSRRQPRWHWISVGSLFAAVAWFVSSALLSWYLASFANYNATYGSLGAGIGMMMWMWISSIVILFGAELNSEIEHQTAHDSTVDGPRPLGARGAVMADTVGKRSSS